MNRLFLAIAASVLGLALLGGTAQARGRHGHHGRAPAARPYYRAHGTAFRGGYYYAGRNHHHWTKRVWSPQYHRFHYWDASLNCWYYWSPAQACYYPITYCQ
jgi:hypothetical protein